MNWQAISFDWNQIRAFLVTAEAGNFSAAARRLGLTQPTLGRQVAALEEHLGLTLFERHGRSLALTQAGMELLDHVRDMGDAAARISLAASGQSQTIEGHVSITASDVLSSYMLPPILAEIREAAPGIDLEIIASNAVRDLRRREADIAIRHVRPTQPDLYARLLRNTTARLYASRSYITRKGMPKLDQTLINHDFISLEQSDRLAVMLREQGIPVATDQFRIMSETGFVAWEMVRHGLGISVMADEIATKVPDIENVLPEMEPVSFPIWLVTHNELQTSRRIRLVFDMLAKGLSDNNTQVAS